MEKVITLSSMTAIVAVISGVGVMNGSATCEATTVQAPRVARVNKLPLIVHISGVDEE